MPGRLEEIRHAEDEGIEILLLTNPLRIVGDDQGWVCGLECQRMELGEPDESGRRRPVALRGQRVRAPRADGHRAIGQRPNPIVQSTTRGLAVGPRRRRDRRRRPAHEPAGGCSRAAISHAAGRR
jgi:glutamate synthase (NADPH/NADH) small chain